MDTKTSKAVSMFKQGNTKEALKIFSTFKLGYSKEEQATIKIAYECLTGKVTFYSSLGHDCEKVIEEATAIITHKYKL